MTLQDWIDRRHGGSRRQFALAAKVPASALCRYFQGEGTLSAASMAKIVTFTNGKVRYADLVPAEEQARP